MDCIFCKVISGDAKSFNVYEDDLIIAFLSKRPILNGHTLVVPKKHFVEIRDIDDESLARIAIVTKKLANDFTKKLNAEGFNIRNNSGIAAHQDIFHFHLHLIPRYKNDGLDLRAKSSENLLPLEEVVNSLGNK